MAPPDQQTLLLAVVLLLVLWLLTRSQYQKVERHERRKPMTEEELGRAVFVVAREADLAAFRQLYLSGGEAQRAMGDAAATYLALRDQRWLVEELVELGARIGDRSLFVGARVGAESLLWLRIRMQSGETAELPAGHALQVGLIWRLRDPVESWDRYGKESAKA